MFKPMFNPVVLDLRATTLHEKLIDRRKSGVDDLLVALIEYQHNRFFAIATMRPRRFNRVIQPKNRRGRLMANGQSARFKRI